MDKKRKLTIRFIEEKIDDCLREDRVFILNIIAEKIGTSFIFQENLGTRIAYNKISDNLLLDIKNHMIEVVKKTKIDLSY